MEPKRDFEKGMLEHLPALRAYARSLANDPSSADDIVQEAILKAWDKQHQYTPGTNLRAWLMTIVRNNFYTSMRRRQREVEDADGEMAAKLSSPPSQLDHLEFQDFLVAFGQLSPEHREALTLVGASGLSYEEAAEVCGVAVGTIKSRVSRGRAALLMFERVDQPNSDPVKTADSAI